MSEITVDNVSTRDTRSDTPSEMSRADQVMRRVLRLPLDGPPATAADAQRAFQRSLLVSAFRCALMYVILPFVLPAIGMATNARTAFVLPVNILAIVMIVMSMRRFWRADHPKRWWYAALGGTVMGFLIFFVVTDIAKLL